MTPPSSQSVGSSSARAPLQQFFQVGQFLDPRLQGGQARGHSQRARRSRSTHELPQGRPFDQGVPNSTQFAGIAQPVLQPAENPRNVSHAG